MNGVILSTLYDAVCGCKMYKEAQYGPDFLLYSSSNFLCYKEQ